jgi:hypothetical protein
MAFRLPTFNLGVNIWHFGNVVANAPDVVTVGNLTYGKRAQAGVASLTAGTTTRPLPSSFVQPMTLLLPPLTDIIMRDAVGGGVGDCVEVPAGSGRFYAVLDVDDIGKGFVNEHRAAVIVMLTSAWQTETANPWAAPNITVPLP